MNLKTSLLCALLCLNLLYFQGCTADEPEPANEPINIIASDVPSETDVANSFMQPDAASVPIITEQKLALYFEEFDRATMLISDGSFTVTYNEPLSKIPQSPCSTFKIPNSLIALEEGIVSTESSEMEWDGTVYKRQEINQNQDLASAMKTSCVWYYQALARQIGTETMQRYLDAIGYGNMDISGGIDAFWLTSSLLISPQEQLDFIMDFYNHNLPFSAKHVEYVKSIMHQDQYSIDLFGKTGSSGDGMGWFVGYTFIDDQPCFFSAYAEGANVTGLLVRDVVAGIFSDLC